MSPFVSRGGGRSSRSRVRLVRAPSVGLALTLTFVFALPVALLAGPASAQSITRQTFLKLERAQKLIDGEEYREARTLLEELANATAEKSYDFAVVNQRLAQTCLVVEDLGCARRALEAALGADELPPDVRANLNLFYGTVLLSEEEYPRAREVLEDWFAAAESPKPTQLFSLAYANYMAGDRARAEPLVARAIAESPEPRTSWYQLDYRVLFELEKYDRAEAVLWKLIALQPTEKQHWRVLASHHLQLEHTDKALAASMVAYLGGLVDEEIYLKQIVSLFGYADIPERGARLLEQLLAERKIEPTPETRRQLANLWLLAREREKAIAVLTKAAPDAPDGSMYEVLGGVYFEDDRFDAAYKAYNEALRKGSLEDPRRVSLLAGISAMRAGRPTDDARRPLEEAAKSKELREQAERLLDQLE